VTRKFASKAQGPLQFPTLLLHFCLEPRASPAEAETQYTTETKNSPKLKIFIAKKEDII